MPAFRIELSRKQGVLRGKAACERERDLCARSRTGGLPPVRVLAYFLHEQKVGRRRPSGHRKEDFHARA